MTGYFARDFQYFLDEIGVIDHLTLVSPITDPWGILNTATDEMFRVYTQSGVATTLYETNGTISDDISKITDGSLWASLTETNGYAYSHIAIETTVGNFNAGDFNAYLALNFVVNNTGLNWTNINDINESEHG